GSDSLGHDVMSQVIFGAYPSLLVGVLAAVGTVVLGLVVGVLAGYYNRLEGSLTCMGDVILTFPPLPFMILLGSLYPPTDFFLILILVVVLLPSVAVPIR